MRMKDKNHENNESENAEGSSEVFHRSLPPTPYRSKWHDDAKASSKKKKKLLLKPQHFKNPKRQRFKPLNPDYQRKQERNLLSILMKKKKKKKIFS